MTDSKLTGRRVYHPIPARDIDPDVVKVVRRLRRHHHEAYLVGGCVRDLLLDAHPKDFDVATSARPRQVRKLFRNSRLIGRRFQLVHVLFRDGKLIEVATFRQAPDESEDDDLLITDDNVFGSAKADAFRRDFTINALFYDLHSREIVDYVEGLADIEQRTVRSIGDPDVRLREDPIRMLRAIKFAARLSLDIEPELAAAIHRHREDISRAAPPRLLEEIYRIFRPGRAALACSLLREAGLVAELLPTVSGWVEADPANRDVQERMLTAFDEACAARRDGPPDAVILATLFYGAWERFLADEEASGDGGGRVDLGALVATLFGESMLRLRVPRRTQDRVRQILVAQRRFDPARRRRRSDAFVSRSYFLDALDVCEIRARAGLMSGGVERVGTWRRRANLPPVAGIPAGEPEPEGEPRPARKRRRRRRRGRGRDGGPQGGGASEG